MDPRRFTLLADGRSDRALIPVLRWLVGTHAPTVTFVMEQADLGRLRHPPRGLRERVERTLQLYPCDVLFVHRDAENEERSVRVEEIEEALGPIALARTKPIPVVPVRMQEAWLLVDESAIREASGNPNGVARLDLPPLRRLERVPDPKAVLYEALCAASGLRGRHLSRFRAKRLRGAAVRVAGLIDDFSPLRHLPAFQALERDVETVCRELMGVGTGHPGEST